MATQLIIGNKKYSSWSLRPWLAMKIKEIEFEEIVSQFDMRTTSQHFYQFSPSKKVPVLIDDNLTLWDSMAILEYLAELHPNKLLWPEHSVTRAKARAIANEMHGGFSAIREECPMNFGRSVAPIKLTERCQWEFSRIDTLWEAALEESGGPFLFAEFTIADAMYAPIVSRIKTYSIELGASMKAYCDTIESLPQYRAWADAGVTESWVVDEVEI